MILFIQETYYKIKFFISFFLLKKKEQRELNNELSFGSFSLDSTREEQLDTQQKYYNGMTLVKNKIKSLAVDRTLEDVLKSTENIVDLANTEADSVKKAMKEAVVYKEADVKTEEDKNRMIDTRINHYYALQNNILKRQLSRQIRVAKQTGNQKEHNKLMEQWNKLYGN